MGVKESASTRAEFVFALLFKLISGGYAMWPNCGVDAKFPLNHPTARSNLMTLGKKCLDE